MLLFGAKYDRWRPESLVRPKRWRIVSVGHRRPQCLVSTAATPLKLPGQIVVPGEHWFGRALHCSRWHAAPAFSAHRSAVLCVYVRGLARRIDRHSARNGLALATSRCRFDWKYRSCDRRRGGRPRIAIETRQLIREMVRGNFLWGAPRIHGELLKLGTTISLATVSRYMPPSRKDRRPHAWRTFVL